MDDAFLNAFNWICYMAIAERVHHLRISDIFHPSTDFINILYAHDEWTNTYVNTNLCKASSSVSIREYDWMMCKENKITKHTRNDVETDRTKHNINNITEQNRKSRSAARHVRNMTSCVTFPSFIIFFLVDFCNILIFRLFVSQLGNGLITFDREEKYWLWFYIHLPLKWKSGDKKKLRWCAFMFTH